MIDADGNEYSAEEVILSGGTYGSPAILLRSGIGPAADLKELGVDVVADPGWSATAGPGVRPQRFRSEARGPPDGARGWVAAVDRVSESVGDELDLHVTVTHLLPGSVSPTGGSIVLAASVVLPESTGTLKLASRDPNKAPLIDSNYVGTGRDARRIIEAFNWARECPPSGLRSLHGRGADPG